MRALLASALVACAPLPPDAAVRFGIAKRMERCLASPLAFELNSFALRCQCDAERACRAAGMSRSCAWDEWQLVTERHYPLIVGYCEARP